MLLFIYTQVFFCHWDDFKILQLATKRNVHFSDSLYAKSMIFWFISYQKEFLNLKLAYFSSEKRYKILRAEIEEQVRLNTEEKKLEFNRVENNVSYYFNLKFQLLTLPGD